jgi:hypothetical protein
MIYSSDASARGEGQHAFKLKHPRVDPSLGTSGEKYRFVYQGGSWHPKDARISKGDIERILQLYPKPPQRMRLASKADWLKDRQKQVTVGIRAESEAEDQPLATETRDSDVARLVREHDRKWREELDWPRSTRSCEI